MGNKHTRSFPSTPVVAKALPPFAPATEPHNSTHLRSRVELKLPHERTLRGCSPNGIGGDGDRGTLATEGGARDAGVNVAPPPGIVRVVHQHPMPGRVTDPSVLVVLNPPTPGRRQLPTRSVRMYAKGPLKTAYPKGAGGGCRRHQRGGAFRASTTAVHRHTRRGRRAPASAVRAEAIGCGVDRTDQASVGAGPGA